MSSQYIQAGLSIDKLLETFKEDVDYVLREAQDFIKQSDDEIALSKVANEFPMDHFTVLKFVLSAQRKKSQAKESALANLIKTLEWRRDNQDILTQAKASKEIQFYVPTAMGGWLGDEAVMVTYLGKADLNELARVYGSREATVHRALVASEQSRRMVDERSRSTGRLCKLLSVVDLSEVSLMKICNRTILGAMNAVSKFNETSTPQMLGRVIIVHAPSMLQAVLTIFRPVLSKNTLEKLAVCKGKSGQSISECPFISKFANGAATVPECNGGSLKAV
jgi:hypothetical protein